jgi:hypothetical protein
METQTQYRKSVDKKGVFVAVETSRRYGLKLISVGVVMCNLQHVKEIVVN